MIALVYLLTAFLLGFAVCRVCLPRLDIFARRDINGNDTGLSPLFLLLPVWLYFGILPLTWFVYLLAVLFQNASHPLFPANAIAIPAALAIAAVLILYSYKRRSAHPEQNAAHPEQNGFPPERKWFSDISKFEYAGIALCIVFVTFLMFWSFRVTDGILKIGYSVFSDFTPHVSMIRSFSRGINFPTSYTPFAGEDIKYHFLYMFLCGNLEYLGFRLDYAFNLPTIIGFLATLSLLYTFGVRLSGHKSAGALAVGLFLFRSSPSVWTYLAGQPSGEVFNALWKTASFIGYTPHEDWGLWNLNVYLNQRHLAFTLGVLILIVMFFVQVFRDGCNRLAQRRIQYSLSPVIEPETDIDSETASGENLPETVMEPETDSDLENLPETIMEPETDSDTVMEPDSDLENQSKPESDTERQPETFIQWLANWIICYCRDSLFSKEAWNFACPDGLEGPGNGQIPESGEGPGNAITKKLFFPIVTGLCLGMLAFWNGAVVIACLLVLFILAALGDGRLSYLITALLACMLTLLQSHIFIRESPFHFSFFFGFIADHRTIFGVLEYIWLLTGLLALLLPWIYARADGFRRGMMLAFAAPFVFAFTVSLTIDPTVNHKYIMIALALLALPAAEFLRGQFADRKKFMEKSAAAVLTFCLMATGLFETRIIANLDRDSIQIPMDDSATVWIMEHTGRHDFLLTSNYSLNNVILSGAECFTIWPYYAWSAGYDSDGREILRAQMYGAPSAEILLTLAHENNIAYIVVDDDNRYSPDYALREDIIAAACDAVFWSGTRNMTIYRVPEN